MTAQIGGYSVPLDVPQGLIDSGHGIVEHRARPGRGMARTVILWSQFGPYRGPMAPSWWRCTMISR